MEWSYLNGNYIVRRSPEGRLEKRALRVGEELISDFPDSIDLKISNRCSWGCPFCHESSVPGGKIFDIEKTKAILSELPEYPIEIAIGGGNVMDTPEETKKLIEWLRLRYLEPRVTVNIHDLPKVQEDLETSDGKSIVYMIGGLGISIQSLNDIKKYWETFYTVAPRHVVYVFHIIAGIFPPQEIPELLDLGFPVLVLGFKQWGRARNTELPGMIETERTIKQYLYNQRRKPRGQQGIISFDNLGLEQLHIKDSLSEEEWDTIYMGDEFSHSMYIDAVEETYGRTSRDPLRVSWKDKTLLEFFKDDTYRK